MHVPETEIIVRGPDGAVILQKSVPPGDYVVGRDPESALFVEAAEVAERHAQLIINYDHALIEDLGSDSGTYVNGQRVTETTRLWPSQKIQVGATTITLRRKRAPADSTQSLAPQSAAVRQLLPDEILREQKYDIGGQIAQGGMGAILSAKEVAVRREVAMKVMLASNSQEDLLRFIEEAQITGQLEHPNIVPVHELSVDENDQVFYTMKLVRGMTLRQVIEQLAQGEREAIKKYQLPALLTIFQKVCDAVAFAHSRGVIHRDLKPENIMLGEFGEVLVMDWGLAKLIGAADRPGSTAVASVKKDAGEISATMAGSILGTPQYMAPEQARGEVEALDARSDVYALGAILYHVLTLRAPVEGASVEEIVAKVSAGQIVPPIQRVLRSKSRVAKSPSAPSPPPGSDPHASTLVHDEASAPIPKLQAQPTVPERIALPHLPGGSIPESLNAVVVKAMAAEKAVRYQSITEFQADLAAYQTGFATRAEHASVMKQILLLIKRNKGVFTTAAAAWLIITALAIWFVINVRASERKATRNAEIAAENEKKAEQNAALAAANEQKAVQEKEATRRALATSQIALAEAAFRQQDDIALRAALDSVPSDLRDSNWDYLLAQSDQSLTNLRTKTRGDVRAAAPDPKNPGVFALIGGDGGVAVVEAHTGARLRQFQAEFVDKGDGNFRLAWSPDGGQLAIAKRYGGIAVYNPNDGTKLQEWKSGEIDTLEFSPDSAALLGAGISEGITLWESPTGQVRWTLPDSAPRAVFFPDGKHILASSKDRLNVLKASDGTVERPLPNARNWLKSMAMRPDGWRAWFGDAYGFLRCIDMKDGRTMFDTHANNEPVTSLAYLKNGDRLVTMATVSGSRASVQIWDGERGVLLEPLMNIPNRSTSISAHPLSREVVVTGGNTTRSWNLSLLNEKWHGGNGVIGGSALFFLGREDWLMGARRVLNLEAASPVDNPLWKSPDSRNYTAAASPDGRLAAVELSVEPYTIHVLQARENSVEEIRAFDPPKALAGCSISGLAFSPSGDRILRGQHILESSTGQKIAELEDFQNLTITASLWLNPTQIVAAVTKGTRGQPDFAEQLRLWDAASGKLLRKVATQNAIFAVAASPDGRTIAEAGANQVVRLRNADSFEVTREFRAHNGPISGLVFHPSRPILATCSEDLLIKLWDLNTGRLMEAWRGPITTPRVPCFSPSGKRFACAAKDQSAWVWDPVSLQGDESAQAKADGWEDLLSKLERDEVAKNGQGWTLGGGALLSPPNGQRVISLPGNFANGNYTLHLTLRELFDKTSFYVSIPVGDRMAGLDFDSKKADQYYTGLTLVNGKSGKELPGVVTGKQIQDSEKHDLTITVQLEGPNATVSTELDGQPLYKWNGPMKSLSQNGYWKAVRPGAFALGSNSADWVVYAAKVKRLEK